MARVVTFGRGCAHHATQATPAAPTPSQPARTPRADPATLSAQPSATRRGSPSQTAVPRPGTSPTPHARQTPASACTARNTATRPSPVRKPQAPRRCTEATQGGAEQVPREFVSPRRVAALRPTERKAAIKVERNPPSLVFRSKLLHDDVVRDGTPDS